MYMYMVLGTVYIYREVYNKGSAPPNKKENCVLLQPSLCCNPHNMARTKQKKQNDPNLSKGACSTHEVCTIQPQAHQKDALTFQEKLTILQKMATMGWMQKQTASYYNNKGYGTWVNQVNISRWLKDKQKMETHVADGGINLTTRRICSVQYPELEAALALWIQQREVRGLTIKG